VYDITILACAVVGTGAALITILPLLGVDIRLFGRSDKFAEIATSPKGRREKRLWIAVALAVVSVALSGTSFYRFQRPRIVEKIVEKPLDRVVEKVIPAECPKSALPVNKPSKQSKTTSNPATTNILSSQDRSTVADKLADFIEEGSRYRQTFVEKDDTALIRQQELGWSVRVEAYLAANLSKGQASEFRNTQSNSAVYLTNHSVEGGTVYNQIGAKIDKLSEFAKELRANMSPSPITLHNSPGSAVSVNQQGGITAGQVNMGMPDRHLSAEQRNSIVVALSGKTCKITSMAALSNVEDGLVYASELRDAFKAGGCDVPGDILPLTSGGWYGVKVSYHDDTAHKEGEQVLVDPRTPQGIVIGALDAARIGEVILGTDMNAQKDEIRVSIGRQRK
jgi:hypothetical protein